MLSAHRALPRFRHDSTVSSWLYRHRGERVLDRLRRNKTHPTSVLENDVYNVGDPTPRVEHRDRGGTCAATASRRAACAVVAVDMQGLLGKARPPHARRAEGTVKSRCSRARAKLAEALEYFNAGAAAPPSGS